MMIRPLDDHRERLRTEFESSNKKSATLFRQLCRNAPREEMCGDPSIRVVNVKPRTIMGVLKTGIGGREIKRRNNLDFMFPCGAYLYTCLRFRDEGKQSNSVGGNATFTIQTLTNISTKRTDSTYRIPPYSNNW